ncbi:Bud-site selection protein [Colletotrichum sublineola]|uniref:Putative NADH-ubiquinone oxidoreductase 30.4 kDa subunit n=1 Tax=Colletotrichum sublineola TaxID=1173701 RepID=A0A066XAE1_COLSU|nr:Bud-site selection protein [Colletotrichum sublineola]KDN65922.1 putative NADH-ubiquinone oxidoreductase 30.4 kDa subunit [Colletotrichum sublineola]
MVKRKRSREDDIEQKLADYRKEIFRALKGAKGLERQRYSKRLRDDKATPDKVKRLEREILVLKSLDLQQTADAHLHSSLLKVKQIAESPALPEAIKQGVPKPELSEEEKAALHNVTSGLFNRVHVREAIEKAVRGVCLILNVPIPEKKKRGNKAAAEDKETEEDQPREVKKTKVAGAKDVSAKIDAQVVEEENPFDEMDDEIPPESGSSEEEKDENLEEVELDEDDEEKAVAKFEAMLGCSDSEDGSGGEDLKAKYQALLGEVADGDTSDDESNSDEDEEGGYEDAVGQDDSDSGMDSDRQRRINAANVSLSPSPEPASRKQKKQARAKKPTGRPGETTFLPSLMGGYISNSESEASDLDLAPPKKRLGQKQRQAIWEKKYGAQANHVKKQTAAQRTGARDSGWDMKRGAVGGEEDGPRKPWKKGVSNPLGAKQGSRRDESRRAAAPEGKPKPPPKRDDEGVLHPSWQARKKAKEEQTMAAFQGTKITF